MKCHDQENNSWYDQVNFDWMVKMTMIVGMIVVSLGALWVMYKFFSLIGRAKVTLEMRGKTNGTNDGKDKKKDENVITNDTQRNDDAKNQKAEAEADKNNGASDASWLDIGDQSVEGDSDKANGDE